MDNTVENDFFGFPKVKWLQLQVRWANVQAVDVNLFGFNTPKIIKIG